MISYFLYDVWPLVTFLGVTPMSFSFQSQTFHLMGASIMHPFVQLLLYHSNGHRILGLVSMFIPFVPWPFSTEKWCLRSCKLHHFMQTSEHLVGLESFGFFLPLAKFDWCISQGHPMTRSLVLSREDAQWSIFFFLGVLMKFTNPNPSPYLSLALFFKKKCVERSLILRFNIWIYIVWLAQQKEKQPNNERKENGSNFPHSAFVVPLFLRSLFQCCWTAHRISRLKGTGKWYWGRGNET